MFHTSPANLPHPHFDEPDADLDAEARLLRITRAIADIGRRNDTLRQQLAEHATRVDALIERIGIRDT